jgi:hypothetical protein
MLEDEGELMKNSCLWGMEHSQGITLSRYTLYKPLIIWVLLNENRQTY